MSEMNDATLDARAIAGAIPLSILIDEIGRRGLCVWTPEARKKSEILFKQMRGRNPAKLDALIERLHAVKARFNNDAPPSEAWPEIIAELQHVWPVLAAFEGGEEHE